MKTICVDDDAGALQHSVSLCRGLPSCTDARGFANGEDALAWLRDHSADLALLDVSMPDMNGLELAARIRTLYPDMKIVFVTARPEYAVRAFEMHVSGYVIKPLSPERLLEEVEHAAVPDRTETPYAVQVRVQTFGNFDILADGEVVRFPRSRAKELLAYLVDRQGSSVDRAEAFTVLWEEGVYDRPRQKQLDVIIRCLRSTLESYGIGGILESRGGFLRIRPERIDCDLYRFFDGDEDAVRAYRGEYMSSYSWASLTEAYMDRIRRKRDGSG